MKDFLGKKVSVGDYIFYSTTGRYPESRLCRISRFTEKSMFGTIVQHNRHASFYQELSQEVVIKNSFVKVEYCPQSINGDAPDL